MSSNRRGSQQPPFRPAPDTEYFNPNNSYMPPPDAFNTPFAGSSSSGIFYPPPTPNTSGETNLYPPEIHIPPGVQGFSNLTINETHIPPPRPPNSNLLHPGGYNSPQQPPFHQPSDQRSQHTHDLSRATSWDSEPRFLRGGPSRTSNQSKSSHYSYNEDGTPRCLCDKYSDPKDDHICKRKFEKYYDNIRAQYQERYDNKMDKIVANDRRIAKKQYHGPEGKQKIKDDNKRYWRDLDDLKSDHKSDVLQMWRPYDKFHGRKSRYSVEEEGEGWKDV